MATDQVPLSGLARTLVAEGILETDAAQRAIVQAKKDRISLISYIVEKKMAQSSDIAYTASIEFGVPLLDLSAMDIALLPKDIIDSKLISKHRILPLHKKGSRLFIGMSDPTNLSALDEIKFHTGSATEAILVEEHKLARAIDTYLDQNDDTFEDMGDEDFSELELEETDRDEQVSASDIGDDAPIVKFVNKMLLQAIRLGASDLHFEPYERTYRVRFRVDGVLKDMSKLPSNTAPKIAARLKVMASLDISERRIPQDGRIKLKVSKTKAIDFRVSSLPTLYGEKIVLRILDPSSAKMGIDALGYEDEQKEIYLEALKKPQGMILVTGPTGSGKTVSLYTGLNIINDERVNIATAEDPVEINLEGINQVNINPKVGLDFASALRAFLRQDPDVIMVGEIRDLETASIAIKAAQTGHMVMSTLHTNSAAETLTRLLNMGVPSFNIATSVNVIIAQRLARRLCNNCKTPLEVPEDTLLKAGFKQDQIQDLTIYSPTGCEECNNGYKGRVGIYEVVQLTPKIQKLIMEEANSITISEACLEEGFNDLRTSGLLKVMQGLTSLEEVSRVTSN